MLDTLKILNLKRCHQNQLLVHGNTLIAYEIILSIYIFSTNLLRQNSSFIQRYLCFISPLSCHILLGCKYIY